MNLVVIGATRGTGQRVLEQAILMGHKVTAIARRPEAILLKHENLTVKQGDAYDLASLKASIAGQDVVISSLGLNDFKTIFRVPTIYSIGTGNVIRAMEAQGVKRLITITSSGVREGDPAEPGWYRNLIKPVFLDRMYQDMRRLEKILPTTKLEWIAVRPTYLTNGPLTGNYRVEINQWPAGGWKISRSDVAHFMLNQLTSDRYVSTGAVLAY
ncbi:MAG: SDR family oxidoreductase [Chloroflexota bacterium]